MKLIKNKKERLSFKSCKTYSANRNFFLRILRDVFCQSFLVLSLISRSSSCVVYKGYKQIF